MLLGPVNGGPAPSVTQTDGVIWEIEIAEVTHTNAGVITIIDYRNPVDLGPILIDNSYVDGVASYSLSGIPAYFDKIYIEFAIETLGSSDFFLRLNGDSAANYLWRVEKRTITGTAAPTITAAGALDTSIKFMETGAGSPARGTLQINQMINANSMGHVASVYAQSFETTTLAIDEAYGEYAGAITPITSLELFFTAGQMQGARFKVYGHIY